MTGKDVRPEARRARLVTGVVAAALGLALLHIVLVQLVRDENGAPAFPLRAWEWNALALVPLAALAFHWHPRQRSPAPNMEPAILVSSSLYLVYGFLSFSGGDLRLFPALLASAATLIGVWLSNRRTAHRA